MQSSGGRSQTQYSIVFIDKELDTFKMKINAIDAETNARIKDFSFKVVSGKYSELTDPTKADGTTECVIGPNYTSNTNPISYTISAESVAQYYKEMDDITVQVEFNDNREVKTTTMNNSTQTSSTYGKLENGGKIGMMKF